MSSISFKMIFDGKKFAAEKEEKLKIKVEEFLRRGIIPKLTVILVGDNPESQLYVSLKEKFAQRIGVEFELRHYSSEKNPKEIIADIKDIERPSNDKSTMHMHGEIVQLPLPEGLQESEWKLKILLAIPPENDIDCLTPENQGLLMAGKPRFLPATVRAVLEILNTALNKPLIANYQLLITERWFIGKSVCVVGASEIVGKPLAMVLSDLGATVTVCRSTTKNLGEYTKKADILISATGVPGLIKKEMVKPGSIVIDVGTKKLEIRNLKLKIAGDVKSDVAEVAGFMTPVPGGVGPVTVACLFENLLQAAGGENG